MHKVILVNCKGNLTKYSRWEGRLGGNLEAELYCNFLSWYGNQSIDVDSLNFEPSISQIWSKFTRFNRLRVFFCYFSISKPLSAVKSLEEEFTWTTWAIIQWAQHHAAIFSSYRSQITEHGTRNTDRIWRSVGWWCVKLTDSWWPKLGANCQKIYSPIKGSRTDELWNLFLSQMLQVNYWPGIQSNWN